MEKDSREVFQKYADRISASKDYSEARKIYLIAERCMDVTYEDLGKLDELTLKKQNKSPKKYRVM